jgi:phage gp46-like protein
MTDLRLKQSFTDNLEAVTLDLLQTPLGLLDETRELETAVILALGTDRLANEDDILPDIDSDDRRGWWGDLEAEAIWSGWPIGSRLWLISRAKITGEKAKIGSLLTRAETYAREALLPLLEKSIASKLAVKAERNGMNRVDLSIVIYRGPKQAVALQFQTLWDEIA